MRRSPRSTFDARRRRVTLLLLVVTLAFGTGVVAFASSFRTEDETAAGESPGTRQVSQVGPRYVPTAADRARPPSVITPDTPLVGLTFDDGPTPERTPYVLDVLAAKGVSATFFFLGEQVEQHPDIARRALAEGHTVGVHSYEHVYFPDLDEARARDQIVRSEEILTEATGRRPVLWRYPFGEASPVADRLLAEHGLVGNVDWDWESNLPGDFECPGADAVTEYVATESADQAMILLHDGGDVVNCGDAQWQYLPRVIDDLRERDLEFGVVEPAGPIAADVAVVAP